MRSSEPIPCSQLVEDVSLEPTWRTPAVLEQDVLSCLSLGGILGGPAECSQLWDRGMSRAVFAPRISVPCEGSVQ